MSAVQVMRGWALFGPDNEMCSDLKKLHTSKSRVLDSIFGKDVPGFSRRRLWNAWKKNGYSMRRVVVTVEEATDEQ